jgi:hypothetical protein
MLETAARGEAEPLHLDDDAGEAPVAKCILGNGKHGRFIASLRVDHAVRMQPGASEGRGEQVAAREAPQHRAT